jgi:hypothetical protein
VAINRESRVESRDGTEHGYTKSTAVEDTSLNADLEPVVQTHSAKAVVPANTSESADASAGLYPGGTVKVGAGGTDAYGLIISEYSSTEGVVSNPKTMDIDRVGPGSGQRKAAGTEGKRVDNRLLASSSTRTSQKSELAS